MNTRMKLYQVDAFTNELFKGNPAAVCPLDDWIDTAVMQRIAAENNLSETAFIVNEPDSGYRIRWFTPTVEVDLCGHATLSSAHVLFEHLDYEGNTIRFQSQSGVLGVTRQEGGWLQLDFPLQEPAPAKTPEHLVEGLGLAPKAVLQHQDYIAVFDNESEILSLAPDFRTLSQIKTRGICVTAPGTDCDFVSRFFGPRAGIDEDPVTGSAHCQLAPYWGKRLGKTVLSAKQVSARGGVINCELKNDRVLISGQAKTYLIGDIFVG